MAGTGGSMMPTLDLSGVVDSGYGVSVGGFHTKTLDLTAKTDGLLAKMPRIDQIVQWESDSHVILLASQSDVVHGRGFPRLASYRREVHKFFLDFPAFLKSLHCTEILSMALSGSNGAVTLTLLYRDRDLSDAS